MLRENDLAWRNRIQAEADIRQAMRGLEDLGQRLCENCGATAKFRTVCGNCQFMEDLVVQRPYWQKVQIEWEKEQLRKRKNLERDGGFLV